MLILKAFVNEKQIDEIHVQNVEYIGNDLYGYQIRKPEEDYPIIYHKRSGGWMVLAKKVLDVLL